MSEIILTCCKTQIKKKVWLFLHFTSVTCVIFCESFICMTFSAPTTSLWPYQISRAITRPNCNGSGDTARMCRLVWALAVGLCDKYHFVISAPRLWWFFLSQLSDFLPVLRLYDLLYPDNFTVALPDITKASSTHTVAATCIWIHLNKKAQTDKAQLQRPIPFALREHLDALRDHLE